MDVKVWSDFICPFCYVGIRRLELAAINTKTKLNLEVMSFELDRSDKEPQKMETALMKKYGWSKSQVKHQNMKIQAMAAELGLHYNFDSMISVNTLKAHRVYQKAKETEFALDFYHRVSKAYFEQGLNIDDEATLQLCAQDVGLPEGFVAQALKASKTLEAVEAEEAMAHKLQIQGVPHFVFENDTVVSGAQTMTHFEQLIEKLNK